ncbi:uncharacterized protein LOC136088029 [Hydra vulgaris]|uniref:Uncharacterized protein LOC136088029 n=1 Tax=Hydra vulgaris TaxID=6087 RepID=A0ABM4D0H1_HYDVU
MWSPNHFVPIVKREVLCLKKFVKSDLKRGSCSVLPSVLSHSSVTTKVLNLSCQPPKNLFSNKKSLVQSHIKFCIDNETKIVDVSIDITPNPILLNCNPCASNQSSSLLFYDVSTYYERGRNLSAGKDDSMLLDLVNKIFIPNLSFVFPVSGEKKKRSFLHKSLLEYSWLAYSQIKDGAYCIPCTLLGSRIPNNTTIINFIQKPFKIWGNATRVYMDHNNNCRLHQMSMHYNYFSWPQRIAFRGHRDDSKYHPQIGETCKDNIGIGNFVELLNFRIEAGDKVLEHHIRSALKNATYISKTAQNELIECCGKTIEEVLIKKIKKSGYFSILCDGASDCSNVEQLSLVIRYIDCDNVICKDFLRFIECKSGTTGLSLAQNIISAIDDLGLDIQNVEVKG